MKREVGLWIDQNKTVMVTVVDDKEETLEIHSNLPKHAGLSGDLHAKKSNRPAKLLVGEVKERKAVNPLNGYYDGVVSMLRNADSIWIFGPGVAKVELKKRLEREAMGERIVGFETVEKMTDHQITAKVRDRYLR